LVSARGECDLDSPAPAAIARDESEREVLVKVNVAETVAVAAPTLVEAGIVRSARTGGDASEVLAELIAAADGVIIDFGPLHWREAVSAWWRFGKGRHPAGLNFGDCLAHAAAVIADEPLLAKREDFPQTDIRLA
jgi:ribonuclease VapC